MTISTTDRLNTPVGPASEQPARSPSRAPTSRLASVESDTEQNQAGPSRLHSTAKRPAIDKRTSTQPGIAEQLRAGPTLFGPGWREVESFDDLSDEEDYESDEEVCFLSSGAQTGPVLSDMPPASWHRLYDSGGRHDEAY
jgi:hypothetical protein